MPRMTAEECTTEKRIECRDMLRAVERSAQQLSRIDLDVLSDEELDRCTERGSIMHKRLGAFRKAFSRFV